MALVKGDVAPSGERSPPVGDASVLLLTVGIVTSISIHAPGGMRPVYPFHEIPFGVISIHASHAGCDSTILLEIGVPVAFRSTHPMRDATKQKYSAPNTCISFRPTHTIRGATCPRLRSPAPLWVGSHLFSFSGRGRAPCGSRWPQRPPPLSGPRPQSQMSALGNG